MIVFPYNHTIDPLKMFPRRREFDELLGLTLVLGAVLFSGCGPSKEAEPNDSYQQATPIKAGRTVTGTISNPKDQDWYRLNILADGVLTVTVPKAETDKPRRIQITAG